MDRRTGRGRTRALRFRTRPDRGGRHPGRCVGPARRGQRDHGVCAAAHPDLRGEWPCHRGADGGAGRPRGGGGTVAERARGDAGTRPADHGRGRAPADRPDPHHDSHHPGRALHRSGSGRVAHRRMGHAGRPGLHRSRRGGDRPARSVRRVAGHRLRRRRRRAAGPRRGGRSRRRPRNHHHRLLGSRRSGGGASGRDGRG